MDWLGEEGSKRFLCLSMPTGSGKSLLAALAAKLSGRRTVILTATKGLQAQIERDFRELGMVDIRGQNSFSCRVVEERMATADQGPCHEGFGCELRENGCPYYDRLREALAARIVVTNYAYYLAQCHYSEGLGKIDLLVMDEGHLAHQALESHLTVHLEKLDVESCGGLWPSKGFEEWEEWREWAEELQPMVASLVEKRKAEIQAQRESGGTVDRALSLYYRTATALDRKLSSIAYSKGEWVWEREGHGWTLVPVWPREYGSRLFREVGKIMAMSALLSEKTMDSLGVDREQREFLHVPSYFPPERTPIIHIPTMRVDHKTKEEDMGLWIGRIDQVIAKRLDRKGIVFTVSYERRNLLLQKSQYRNIMISHAQRDVVEMVNRFKNARPPAVLVSPAITSGWDFPYGDCSYMIISKLAFPDTRGAVMKRRCDEDKDWSSWLAMETIVQESGRSTRAADDGSEVFILDDHWKWFWPRYKEFAPVWFRERVKGSREVVPDAPILEGGRT